MQRALHRALGRLCVVALVLLQAVLAALPAQAAAAAAASETEELIVAFTEAGFARASKAQPKRGAQVRKTLGGRRAQVLRVDRAAAAALRAAYAADRAVRYVEPNGRVRAAAPPPNDPAFPRQWAHAAMRTLTAWDTTRGDR